MIARHLTLGGADAKTAKRANLEDLWVETVKANPGLTTGALCQILGKGTDDKGLAAARKWAIYYKKSSPLGLVQRPCGIQPTTFHHSKWLWRLPKCR
jgi:hypothetical protein